jgi:hypothetical protein
MAKRLFGLFVVAGLLAVASVSLRGQSEPSLEGVWRTEEVVVTGGINPRTIKNHAPDIYIFTERYYSSIGVRTTRRCTSR